MFHDLRKHLFGATLVTIWLGFAVTAFAQNIPQGTPVQIMGDLEVLIFEDFENQRSTMRYLVRDAVSNRLLELKFNRKPARHLSTGQRVWVRGQRINDTIWVEALQEETDSNLSTPQVAELPIVVPEERRAVVLMVDLLDASASSNYTLEQIAENMWTGTRSVDGLYRDASLDQLSFPADSDGDLAPDVFGPFSIDYSGASCDFYDWALAAENAAQAAGVDLSLYQHRVFVLPHFSELPACSWSGVANVGCGSFCRVWITEGESPMVFAHELGHNLGLAHAGTDPENDGQMNLTYGDYSDPMGLSRKWHRFNAPHIDQMGWYTDSPWSTLTVMASGTYDLTAIGIDPSFASAPQILKIEKPDSGEFYYLSLRQPVGYDDSLASTYTQGVNIHRYQGSGYGYSYFITSLNDGESFIDEANLISVTQLTHTSDYLTIDVALDGVVGGNCTTATPTVAISPSDILVQPGQVVSYTATMINNDVGDCGVTTFDLTYQGTPVSWLSTPTLTLGPGESGSSNLTVDTAGLMDGTYMMVVQATDSLEPTDVGQGSTEIAVDGTPPSAPIGLGATTNADGTITLTWSASTDAIAGVAFYTPYRNGIPLSQTTNNNYIDTNVVAGASYTYTVTATDAVGNESEHSIAVSIVGGTDSTLHVGDLDANTMIDRNKWIAEVTVSIHDAQHNPVPAATVNGNWIGGVIGLDVCTTNSAGQCTFIMDKIRKNIASAIFTVTDVADGTLIYQAMGNHDPDGDSDGTRITVLQP